MSNPQTTLPDFGKFSDRLVPAVVQDAATQQVLMLGYMNQQAYEQTLATGTVTFYSRSRAALWVKGETSGNYLHLVALHLDCDQDSLLILASPDGPTCHTGSVSCFAGNEAGPLAFIGQLESTIADRKANPNTSSYTASLFAEGLPRMAQKVGEEAVETVIEALLQDDAKFIGEAADLLFHYLVLLQAKNKTLEDVVHKLKERHK